MSSAVRYLGVTNPISTAPPDPRDVEMTRELVAYLRAGGFFEGEEESERREVVLGKLNRLVQEWVRQRGKEKGLPESVVKEAGGKIFTFGSYRLGVHSTGADIDTLCVVPQHVERIDLFTSFHALLATHPEVKELTAVPDAYVPVMKMVFSGIPIDLVFARLAMPTIPDDLDLLDPSILRNLEEKCILSLNGSRTTDEILRLVPDIPTFHIALRCIKLWAKRRAIYSNAMGYVGGVACALLTARICQLYPCASASAIITRFFKIYGQWAWPQPVLLKSIEDIGLGMRVWNPRIYPQDRAHRMPIITPAYPSMCSTHNVLQSNLQVMTEEFKRGQEIMLRIEQHKATWDDLFAPTDFFCRYRHFFQIIAHSTSAEHQRMWSGYMGSKIRLLASKLELEDHIELAPPYYESFDVNLEIPETDLSNPAAMRAAIYRAHEKAAEDGKQAEQAAEEEVEMVTIYTTTYYVAIQATPLDPASNATGRRRLILDRPVQEFTMFVTSQWDKRLPNMQLEVRNLRRDNLPDYCFPFHPRPGKANTVAGGKRVKGKTGSPEPKEGEAGKRSRSQSMVGDDNLAESAPTTTTTTI